ncbi:blast:Glycoprotein 3-alpha-L-fucosyltransferase A [Drosophila guanche]|uniref:Fucosyltransferase n=1 Tax=Drosophila guanche TaxID=7266 RepID=A0A3B0JKW6_DROGU|nr:blast:Glycoprotein 3-alpha-L-fucosyltransferase A [Drosophila guanche]
MRRPKISLKKYFYFTLICALLLIYGFNLKEYEIWKTRSPRTIQTTTQQHQQKPQQFPATEVDCSEELSKTPETSSSNPAPLLATSASPAAPAQGPSVDGQQTEDVEDEEIEADRYLEPEPEPAPAKPWFFRNGEYYPSPSKTYSNRRERKRYAPKLLPHQDSHNDRIVNQLMYVPHNYEVIKASGKLKTILLYNGLGPWNVKKGREVFLNAKCPVDTCELTANRDMASTADMILYKDHYIPTAIRRPSNAKQVSMLYYLECPYHTQNVKAPDAINWTATYRRDSTIVAPYEKWQYYDTKVQQQEQDHNYAVNKTKKVAWFVSNCGARNGRLRYAHELQKHIEVEIGIGLDQEKILTNIFLPVNRSNHFFHCPNRLIYMVPVETSSARVARQTNASRYLTTIISSTWPSKTPTARTTSRRNSLSMPSIGGCCQL